MHAKILFLSDNREDSAEYDYDDLNIIGGDWFGENYPDQAASFIESNFGLDICKFTPMQSETNESLIGRIRFNRKSIAFAKRCVSEWQQRVASITPDEIIERHYIPSELLEDIKVSRADYLIHYCGCYYTVMEWMLEVVGYYLNKNLYVVGCIDYHY